MNLSGLTEQSLKCIFNLKKKKQVSLYSHLFKNEDNIYAYICKFYFWKDIPETLTDDTSGETDWKTRDLEWKGKFSPLAYYLILPLYIMFLSLKN